MTDITTPKIIRSRRRTITLQVCPDATLVIRAPIKASDAYINKLIESKRSWITRKQELAQQQISATPAKRFVAGEEFLYLGETYKLYVEPIQRAPLVFNKAFHLAQKRQDRARQEFTKWYRQQARTVITARVNTCAAQAGLQYRKIKISGAQKRWGSCSRVNNLNFSWRLIMAPLAVIDYVVAHEVAHLEHKNHSRNFWNKVAGLDPEYKQRRKWLRQNDYLLKL
ncbi:MAG TPA: SprT family zinc-dependent metalloprotease [Planctomycetota bacterium]|nr:SprT family zinc-dependent metalloprotease [Planctomycetota bacterium]